MQMQNVKCTSGLHDAFSVLNSLRGRSEVLKESSLADVLLADELERVLQRWR